MSATCAGVRTRQKTMLPRPMKRKHNEIENIFIHSYIYLFVCVKEPPALRQHITGAVCRWRVGAIAGTSWQCVPDPHLRPVNFSIHSTLHGNIPRNLSALPALGHSKPLESKHWIQPETYPCLGLERLHPTRVSMTPANWVKSRALHANGCGTHSHAQKNPH